MIYWKLLTGTLIYAAIHRVLWVFVHASIDDVRQLVTESSVKYAVSQQMFHKSMIRKIMKNVWVVMKLWCTVMEGVKSWNWKQRMEEARQRTGGKDGTAPWMDAGQFRAWKFHPISSNSAEQKKRIDHSSADERINFVVKGLWKLSNPTGL